MVQIIFSSSLSEEGQTIVSRDSLEVIRTAAEEAKNPAITITSTIRLPAKQARIMYDNLAAGNNIRYAAPGREVCQVYEQAKAQKLSREDTILRMTERIAVLALKGQRVSKHCVTAEQYAKLNVIDLSQRIPNPRDMVKELIKDPLVEKVITPYTSDYKSSKVLIDANEPAIHIEIVQA